jgi:hypothetical protein
MREFCLSSFSIYSCDKSGKYTIKTMAEVCFIFLDSTQLIVICFFLSWFLHWHKALLTKLLQLLPDSFGPSDLAGLTEDKRIFWMLKIHAVARWLHISSEIWNPGSCVLKTKEEILKIKSKRSSFSLIITIQIHTTLYWLTEYRLSKHNLPHCWGVRQKKRPFF